MLFHVWVSNIVKYEENSRKLYEEEGREGRREEGEKNVGNNTKENLSNSRYIYIHPTSLNS